MFKQTMPICFTYVFRNEFVWYQHWQISEDLCEGVHESGGSGEPMPEPAKPGSLAPFPLELL